MLIVYVFKISILFIMFFPEFILILKVFYTSKKIIVIPKRLINQQLTGFINDIKVSSIKLFFLSLLKISLVKSDLLLNLCKSVSTKLSSFPV